MADVRRLLRAGALGGAEPGANTTLAVVATNARMTKTQMAKVAQMAHDGFARAIVPVHTPVDGDTAFALATGSLGRGADLLVVGSLAADVTAEAIVAAARAATGLPSCRPRAISRADRCRSTSGCSRSSSPCRSASASGSGAGCAAPATSSSPSRRLPAPLVFATFLAANIGAGSTIGAASLGYRIGLGGWWWNASAGLGSLVFAAWAGPRLWTIARDRGFLTLGDWLEWRYGRAVRGVSSVIIWFISLSILAGQLLGASSILASGRGAAAMGGALAAAVVVVVYFVAGGLLSLGVGQPGATGRQARGVPFAVPIALALVGGWSAMSQRAGPAGRLSVAHGRDRIAALVHRAPRAGIHRLAGARPERVRGRSAQCRAHRRRRRTRSGSSLFAIVPVTLGMVARVLHPALASPDQALPTLLAVDLPPLVGALTLAGVFAAEVSAADAVLFMLSTSSSQDLYRRFLAPEAERRPHPAGRAAGSAVAAGVAGLAMALVLPTVVDALKIFYSLLTVALFVPVVAGLLWHRPDDAGSARLDRRGDTVDAGHPRRHGGPWIDGWPPVALGLVVSAASFAAVAMLRRPA